MTYADLQAMQPPAAAEYVYRNYDKLKGNPDVARWIDENAKVYADTAKRLQYKVDHDK
jgi:hypothetical protein